MDRSRKRTIRLVVALGAAVLLFLLCWGSVLWFVAKITNGDYIPRQNIFVRMLMLGAGVYFAMAGFSMLWQFVEMF